MNLISPSELSRLSRKSLSCIASHKENMPGQIISDVKHFDRDPALAYLAALPARGKYERKPKISKP